MRHFLIYNQYGPIVVTQRESHWIVNVPHRAPEVFTRNFPRDCLSDAREVSPEEATTALGSALVLPESNPARLAL
jgi:hypothetical protein